MTNEHPAEDGAGLDISDPAFMMFIFAKIISVPTIGLIFINKILAIVFLSLYGALIFSSVFLCIKKMLYNNE